MAATVFPFCTNGTGGLEGSNYPDEGLVITPSFSTVIVTAMNLVEQRRALLTSPRHEFVYRWTHQTNDKTIMATLYDFFVARKGSYEAFGLFEFDASTTWNTLTLGTAAGTLGETVNSMARNTSSRSIYLNGVLKTNYTVSAGGGTNGRDLITNTTPAWTAGQTITETFKGQRWFVVRFKDDKMDFKLFSAKLFDTGLSLIEAVGET